MALLMLFRYRSLVQIDARSHFTASLELLRQSHAVLSVERQYTAWSGVIPAPFYHGIPSLTVVYRGKLLSFSTRVSMHYEVGIEVCHLEQYYNQSTFPLVSFLFLSFLKTQCVWLNLVYGFCTKLL